MLIFVKVNFKGRDNGKDKTYISKYWVTSSGGNSKPKFMSIRFIAFRYIKQNLTEIKERIDKSTIIVGDF